jgi:hypothetical protein
MVRIRSWAAALANGLFSLVLGSASVSGGSPPTLDTPSIPSRVAAVRSALAEKQASSLLPGTSQIDDDAFREVAQQWRDWNNWNNWNNWGNWGNWGNWANY